VIPCEHEWMEKKEGNERSANNLRHWWSGILLFTTDDDLSNNRVAKHLMYQVERI
jgi:hypothetical protein